MHGMIIVRSFDAYGNKKRIFDFTMRSYYHRRENFAIHTSSVTCIIYGKIVYRRAVENLRDACVHVVSRRTGIPPLRVRSRR